VLIAPLLLAAQAALPVSSPAAESAPTYTVEYYYKVRWGFQAEFLKLFLKNHLPILKKERDMGRIVEIRMEAPREHMTEDARWDYRVTLVFASAEAALSPSAVTEAQRKAMYPDQATFEREEQRRFELLMAHWDLPLVPVDQGS